MKIKFLLAFFLIVLAKNSWAVVDSSYASESDDDLEFWERPDTIVPGRLKPVVVSAALLYTGALIGLNEVWYSDYPKAPMHAYNDWGEWRNMDKLGHMYGGYMQTRIMMDMFKWTGLDARRSRIYGGLCGAAFQSIVEVLDGYSDKWGFSWPDMGANMLGVGIAVAQDAFWNDQRIQLKFSSHIINYQAGIRSDRADSLYGASSSERILKDYNGQTYWYSFNAHSFFPQSKIPKWLNLSVGVGAEGMFGGYSNTWYNKWDQNTYSIDQRRYAQWYLSPDIDLTKIKTNRKGIKFAFYLLNIIKIPLPTLQYDTENGFKFHAIYF